MFRTEKTALFLEPRIACDGIPETTEWRDERPGSSGAQVEDPDQALPETGMHLDTRLCILSVYHNTKAFIFSTCCAVLVLAIPTAITTEEIKIQSGFDMPCTKATVIILTPGSSLPSFSSSLGTQNPR